MHVLTLARPGTETGHILPLAFGSEGEEVPGVRRVQIIQAGPTALVVKIEPGAGADRAAVATCVRRRLDDYLVRQGIASVAVLVSNGPPQEERSGTFRQVYRQGTP